MQGQYQLKQIDPKDVDFSLFNPRGESEEQIQDDETFEQLKDSVYKYGVLVPIVVHEQQGKPKPYRLVDGERRLRAALLTGRPRIPAHVASVSDPMDDLVRAFHIHMLRKQWKPVAIARALKRMAEQLQSAHPGADEEQLFEELQTNTGCSDDRLKALRRAARYPEKVLDDVANGKLLWSYLIEFEGSCIEQVDAHFPQILRKIGKRQARHILVEKAKRKILSGTRALLNNIAPVVARAKTAQEKAIAEGLLLEFFTDQDMPAEEVLKGFERAFPSSDLDAVDLGNMILEQAETLTSVLRRVKPDILRGYPELSRKLEGALRDLKRSATSTLKMLKSAE